MHTIGIDFGTTKTLVSRIVAETGRPETVRLGQGKDHITTSVFIMDTGEMVFGDEADDRMADPDGVYLRGFKMSLGSNTPLHVQMNSEVPEPSTATLSLLALAALAARRRRK